MRKVDKKDLHCRIGDAPRGLVQIKLFEPQNLEKVDTAHDPIQDGQIFIFQSLRALVSSFQSIASFLWKLTRRNVSILQ
jgi:hypothetical protein